jgi:hypothetical protein
MIKCQLVLVQLAQYSANVQMRVRLHLRALESRLNSQSLLQEIQRRPHLPNPSIVAGHVVVRHCLAQFVIFTKFFGFF